jgi:hypothetical protein
VLALVFSFSLQAKLKIAIIDTGFCQSKFIVNSKNITILNSIDMTETNSMNCDKVTSHDLSSQKRYHGQKVVNELLKYVPPTISFTLFPLVVFDNTGTQSEKGWLKAIEFIKKEKIDVVVSAAGFIKKNAMTTELPGIWFVASGRIERLIDTKTILFPHLLAPLNNLFLIGDYFNDAQIIYDQSLLYADKIDYHFPSGKGHFTGTSRSVAEAVGKALLLCYQEKDIVPIQTLRTCLLKNEIILKDQILNKKFKTF